MNLNLSAEQFEKLVGAAILEQLSADERNKILETAITSLLTPEKSYSGPNVSPLQSAFNRAIANQAERIAAEWLVAEPERLKQVEQLVADAFFKLMGDEYDSAVKRLVGAMGEALAKNRY